MTQTTKHPVDDEADVQDSASSVDADSDVENQRQLNDLRREYLDDRSDSINQWLVVIGLVLAFFAVAIPVGTGIAAYFAYTQFQRIESEAQEHLDEAKRYASEAAQYLKDIQAQKKIAEEVVSELTSEDISKLIQPGTSEASSEVENLLQKIQQDPGASVIDRAIVEANRLQQEGKVDDAIKKWGSIANTSEGIDNDKAAAAFLARGAANSNLGKHDEAISDYNEAIRLNPNFAGVYVLRGVAHGNLGKNDEAILDFNEAIRLNPNLAEAYLTRGFTNETLRRVEEAQADYQMGLKVAEQQGNEDIKTTIEESLQRLKNIE